MTYEEIPKEVRRLLPDDVPVQGDSDFPRYVPPKPKCDLCEEETESKDLYEISRCCCAEDRICHKCMNTATLKDFYNKLVANVLTTKAE